jgi:hypothetical protein
MRLVHVVLEFWGDAQGVVCLEMMTMHWLKNQLLEAGDQWR